MDEEIGYLSAHELRTRYRSGELSPIEVVRVLGERIEALDTRLNTMTTTALEQAQRAAHASHQRYREGRPLPLDGVPVAVKDLIDTADVRTTYGSKMFADHLPDRDAHVVSRIRAAGGLVIGKSATHEFAWGITTDNEHYGTTRNPWAPERIPGGSSGGSAAALAAGLAPLALGTDTAGSIRIPAAFCGVVGLKPTHGSVDSTGVLPLAPSLDHIGPMARTVPDVRLLLSVIRHRGPRPDSPIRGVRGLRVGICPGLDQVPLCPAVRAARDAAADALADLGAEVAVIPVPAPPPLFATLSTLVLAEGSQVHRQAGLWPTRAAEYGREVRARLEQAALTDPRDHFASRQHRLRIRALMRRIFTTADILLSAVSAVPPPPVGREAVHHAGRLRSLRELVITSTAPQSLSGFPSCTVRAGFDDLGLPIGVQLTAPPWAEQRLLQVAESLYRATEPVQRRRPTAVPFGPHTGA